MNHHAVITIKKGVGFSVKRTSKVIGTIMIQFKYKINMTAAVSIL